MDVKYLYMWDTVAEKPMSENNRCFLEEELKLMKFGFRTRVVRGESGFLLQVPLKDAVIAREFLEGRVADVINKPIEMYHVFDQHLNYSNENLDPEYNRSQGLKFVGIGRFWFLAIILFFLMIFFRFVEF